MWVFRPCCWASDIGLSWRFWGFDVDREPSSFFLMINFVLQFLGFSVLIFVLHFEVGLVFFFYLTILS